MELSRAPVCVFQNLMLRSAVPPPEASRLDWKGHHASALTAAACAVILCTGWPPGAHEPFFFACPHRRSFSDALKHPIHMYAGPFAQEQDHSERRLKPCANGRTPEVQQVLMARGGNADSNSTQ